jgi:hypothetical protein
MKRTLIEILGFIAVLFLFGSLHQRIHWLNDTTEEKDKQLAEVKTLLSETRRRLEERGNPAALSAVNRMEKQLEEIAGRVGEVTDKMDRSGKVAEDQSSKVQSEMRRTRDALLDDVKRERQALEAESKRLELRTRDLEQNLSDQRSTLDRIQAAFARNRDEMRHAMLDPTVQLNGDETVGSGTLIYSRRARAGQGDGYESYLITSYHVVRNIMADPGFQKSKGIAVSLYCGDKPREEAADMTIHNEAIDAAILKLRCKERCPVVARIAGPERVKRVEVFTGIYAVGCPLGNDPIPTAGFVTSLTNKVNGSNYWMVNAPTYFGNSGGGIFLEDTRELIAVFSKIYTHGKTRPVVITHMGLATPMNLVSEWLKAEKQEFLLATGEERVEPAVAPAPGK